VRHLTGSEPVEDTRVGVRPPRRPVMLGVMVSTLAAAVAVGIWWGARSGVVDGFGATLAVVIAVGVFAVAVSLPGKTPQGLLLGIGIPLAAMMAWTRLDQPFYVWLVTGLIGLAAAVWTFPWWRDAGHVLRLGGFWLAVGLWLAGAVSALALGRTGVLAGRVVYGGFAVVVALLIFQTRWRRGRDISVGIAAGLMICHALLLALGSQYVFETNEFHVTSDSAWGLAQSSRFWGGPWLVYHPNFIAMTGLLVAIRIGADARFAPWQRLTAVGNGALLLYIADSRTSLLMAGVASVAYGLLHIWRNGLPRFRFWTWFATPRARRVLAQALLPLAVTFLVFGAAGGTDMLFKQRYAQPSATALTPAQQEESRRNVNAALSGRADVWGMIFADFRRDTVVEKLFGNTDFPRGEIHRYRDPADPRSAGQAELSADNVAVGALRRGGVVGLVLILVGAGLVLWRVFRRGAPVWIPVLVLAGLASVISEDELVGTTPLWTLVFAGEIWMYANARGRLLTSGEDRSESGRPEAGPSDPVSA
jgi:hypothetical protein